MKFDKTLVAKIVRCVEDNLYMQYGSEFMEGCFIMDLLDLDLVFKPDDPSQSLLVDNE